MRNPEVMSQAMEARLEAEQALMGKLSELRNTVKNEQLRREVVEKPPMDPAVKELVVNALKNAREKQLSLVKWTEEIMEGAKLMTANQQEQVIELTAKVTARQGIPTFEQPILSGEGQIEAA